MSVADILSQLAANAGRAQLQRGQIYGDLVNNVANVPAQILNQREADRLLARGQARQDLQDSFARDANARAKAKDSRDAAQQGKDDAEQQRKEQERQDRGAIMAAGLDTTGPTPAFKFEPAVAEAMRRGRKDVALELVSEHDKATKSAAPKTQAELAADAANPNSTTQAQSSTALDLLRPPKAEPAPRAPGPIHDTPNGLVRIGDDNSITPLGVKGYHPPVASASPDGANNVRDAVAGMKDGTLPPQMPGRASKDYTAILAEARRQGFDLGKANLDWNATQKHVATMNGAQQLRLNQAINALPDMLDKVDALASQWKGGKFPILNKANLALAKGGAYGSDVASIANQLDAQIADVTADLGNVYMGGNSPTDHALGLAGKSLNGAWDEKVLHDMVKLAKTNVTIRSNSIKNTGVAGASADNPYAAPAAAPTTGPAIGERRMISGQLGEWDGKGWKAVVPR